MTYRVFACTAILYFGAASAGWAQSRPEALDSVTAQTLCLSEEGKTLEGYFPMGFVMGAADFPLDAGFSLRDETFRWPPFIHGTPFPTTIDATDSHGFRYFSRVRGAEVLGGSLARAAKEGKLSIKTQNYGWLPSALDVNGKTYPRGLVDIFNAATEKYLLDYAEANIKAYGADSAHAKAVVLWGLDNEWEGAPNYGTDARADFAPWLHRAYGTVGALNAAWGTKYESFDAAAQGKLPSAQDYAAQPAAFLDWWNFQTETFTTVLSRIAKVIHETDPQHRGVAHKSTQQTIEMPGANRERTFDHAEFADRMRPYSGGYYGMDIYGSGDRQTYEANFIYNCIRPADRSAGYGTFLCETNNHGGPGHQFASTFWRLLGNGFKAVDFFTPGFAGAKGDWASFGFLDASTGKLRDKAFYAARWTSMIHRTERFWTESAPAEKMPRLAMVLPRRDILLSEPSGRDRKKGKWSYPENHRWMIFRWLREQGYWVDVIPYSKLQPSYLAAYQGLLLIGAEHLTAGECETIRAYVNGGGVLVADERPGYYDEHHRVVNRMESLLGVKFKEAARGPLKVKTSDGVFTGAGRVEVDPVTAKPLLHTTDGKPAALVQTQGKGTVLSLPFKLGSLISQAATTECVNILIDGPTADSEEYLPTATEMNLGAWLGELLGQVNLKRAYQFPGTAKEVSGKIRVEQPMIDRRGNVAVVISNRALSLTQEMIPACTLEVTLPGGPWTFGFWAPAEHDGLEPVKVELVADQRYRLSLPAMPSAGVLYLMPDHAPLLGIARLGGANEPRAVDKETLQVKAGVPFKVSVRLANTTAGELTPGTLRLITRAGWTVTPASQPTGAVARGQFKDYEFEVTPDPDDMRLTPDRLSPIVARWNDGKSDAAIISAIVEAVPAPEKTRRLLSDNASFPASYPYQLKTGAQYLYLAPIAAQIADPERDGFGKTSGRSLLNGFASFTGTRDSQPFWNNRGCHAQYKSAAVEIVFDLQASHELSDLVVVAGPGENKPVRVTAATSVDGKTYASAGEMAPARPRHEMTLKLNHPNARFVRVKVEWSQPGGTLDEVEIWGR